MQEINTDKKAIDIRGMAPLLLVFDMPRAIHFYRDILGFDVIEQAPLGDDDCDWALLRLNSVELMLNTAHEKQDRPEAPDPVRIASHMDTSIYFGCPDVDAAFKHLTSRGVDVKEPFITSYGWKAMFVTDPDGFILCFHWPATE